ncbi:hypothetical protein KAJ27_09370 [bacterium]|nr:hypothetical protein [bacterium]
MRKKLIINDIEIFLRRLEISSNIGNDSAPIDLNKSFSLMNNGTTQLKKDNLQFAISLFTEAIDLVTNNLYILKEFHKIRAIVYLLNNQFKEAIEDFGIHDPDCFSAIHHTEQKNNVHIH